MRKSKGPNMDPCGTPVEIGWLFDSIFLNMTYIYTTTRTPARIVEKTLGDRSSTRSCHEILGLLFGSLTSDPPKSSKSILNL